MSFNDLLKIIVYATVHWAPAELFGLGQGSAVHSSPWPRIACQSRGASRMDMWGIGVQMGQCLTITWRLCK